jgi:hypothetical protein
MGEPSKLGVLAHHRSLRQKKPAEACIVLNGEGFEAGLEGNPDIGAEVIATISIGCRIGLAIHSDVTSSTASCVCGLRAGANSEPTYSSLA